MSNAFPRSKKRGPVIKIRTPIWTTRARRDLTEDHAYIETENPVAADRLVLDIFNKIESIATLGSSGVSRSGYGAGLRSITFRERVIFFRVDEADLTVLRLLHGHQDNSAKDFKQEEN
ncbi:MULTISPECIES: type II toxin-antitoxin system RelE/ParE family toxin [unclassified Rhizobium]|uniref:type II toxin-antitoxin system RelE/ParE family toxin n=1 Tax=unclassified Rhizobium TaxID=2613769 RepID=UPI002B232083|nr:MULTISPECIES: type II toxin-antitoxin system RelE/ParE family toxin [unclassified Rhizobium]